MTGRKPRTKAEKVNALLEVARSGEFSVREIAQLARINDLEAWEIVARGVKAGRLKVRDEDRRHQWIQVIDRAPEDNHG